MNKSFILKPNTYNKSVVGDRKWEIPQATVGKGIVVQILFKISNSE